MQTIVKRSSPTKYVLPPRTGLEVFEMLPEGTNCELINDLLIMPPPPTTRHQDIVSDIYYEIKKFLKKKKAGRVFFSPVAVYLDEKNVFEPDIVFVLKENEHIIQDKGIVGVPDLIIEVLSNATEKYDKGEKKEKYLKSGVKEYWLVDQYTKECMGYRKKKTGAEEFRKSKEEIKFDLLNLTIKF